MGCVQHLLMFTLSAEMAPITFADVIFGDSQKWLLRRPGYQLSQLDILWAMRKE
jgi:hypothetical protein